MIAKIEPLCKNKNGVKININIYFTLSAQVFLNLSKYAHT